MIAPDGARGERDQVDRLVDRSIGGADIDRLTKWAERRQDRTRRPFRWVGYDGDPNTVAGITST